ncbi:MAG TPA: DUF1629 domain-containing protein [Myxococcus sp.]|nr:DUF1629 domain-containing protein [Myxococcus sp.]
MRYFKLSDDVDVPGQWELGTPMDGQGQECGSWLFMRGEPVQVEGPLHVPVDRAGKPLDFSLADVGTIPVVTPSLATLLTRLAPNDVQFFPVEVDAGKEPYFLLNVARLVKCIDDAASGEVRYWKPEDGRPEKAGRYRSVSNLRIDPAKVGDAKVFRTWGWTIALIVSEDIKHALEQEGFTGLRFREVTGPSAISPEERERNQTLLALREQTDAARHGFWRTLGRLDEEAYIPPILGGAWPSRRQLWQVIRRMNGRTLLVTDGLSDFFSDEARPSVGFGLELALETDEPLREVARSWAHLILERVGDVVAEQESVRERVKAGLVTLEISAKNLPSGLVNPEGQAGVLLGLESSALPPRFTLPAGEVRLITLKALLPSELAYLQERGKPGLEELTGRFVKSGDEHLSRSQRHPATSSAASGTPRTRPRR